MDGIFFLFVFFISTIKRVNGYGELKLAIYDNNGDQIKGTFIVRNVNDSLILFCRTQLDNSDINVIRNKPHLIWILPTSMNRPHNVFRPYRIVPQEWGVQLIVEHLTESDAGLYKCINSNGKKEIQPTTVHLIIKKSLNCGKGVFCENHCILERYKCDGVVDCKNGKDEHEQMCGPDPCKDKIKCSDGRCIPQSWCCSSGNCTQKWDIVCCPKVKRGPMSHDFNSVAGPFHEPDVVFREFGDRPVNYLNNPQHYTDLNFLQTTIYAVFGCAILFMLIITILVVIMQCKLQMRRNWQFQLLNRQRLFGNTTYHRSLNQEGLMDMMVERYNNANLNGNAVDGGGNNAIPPGAGNLHPQRNSTTTTTPNGLLVTYNINNGVQIVGKPIEPPPYSEVAPRPPQDQGPPPPYIPRSDEGEDVAATTSSNNKKNERKKNRNLSKSQASSEPTLSNIS